MSETITTDFAAEWEAWHAAHEAARASAHGFLAVTSMRWLTEEPERFPDAPGAWSTGPDGVVVELGEGESLAIAGREVRGRHAFGPIAERASVTAGFGDAVVEVARRGGADLLRPRHPDSPRLAGYTGTPTYPPDRRWALPASFEAYAEPVEVLVGSVVDGLEHVYRAVGEVVVEIDGSPLRLVAFPGRVPDTLLVLFRDLTSSVTTSASVRSLSLPAPDEDGHLVLDFNRAVNLPCAYTPYATCPLPPVGNHLPSAVEAGEKVPGTTSGYRG